MSLNIQSKLVLGAVCVVISMALLWQPVSSHGRLVGPPARSTMWRYGFATPVNYQDNELFCGGFTHQVNMGYKCGICGDPWDVTPRPHEAGGVFATGTIAANYTQGEEIVIDVELTANHKGWFEFKLCPTNDFRDKATQDCLDLYPLQLSDGSGTKLDVTGLGSTMISIPVRLPATLTCDFCVLQWHYHAGNSWGTDPDGTSCVGCGYQEEFYGCADVTISPNGSPQPSTGPPPSATGAASGGSSSNPTQPPSITSVQTAATRPTTNAQTNGLTTNAQTTSLATNAQTITNGAATTTDDTAAPTAWPGSSSSGVPMILSCRAKLFIPGLQEWCDTNCNLDYCPHTHCACESIPEPRAAHGANLAPGCYATTPFVNWPGIEEWCSLNCLHGICHDNRCFCKF